MCGDGLSLRRRRVEAGTPVSHDGVAGNIGGSGLGRRTSDVRVRDFSEGSPPLRGPPSFPKRGLGGVWSSARDCVVVVDRKTACDRLPLPEPPAPRFASPPLREPPASRAPRFASPPLREPPASRAPRFASPPLREPP